jgi:hypothetical protein
MVQQLQSKTIRLVTVFEEKAVILHSGSTEVVRNRPNCDNEVIVSEPMSTDQFRAVIVENRRHDDLPRCSIDGLQRAVEEAVAPTMSVATIANFVKIRVERSRRHLMEERLPDMSVVPLHKNDIEILAAEPCSEPPHELQTSSPTANDHYLNLHSRLPGPWRNARRDNQTAVSGRRARWQSSLVSIA